MRARSLFISLVSFSATLLCYSANPATADSSAECQAGMVLTAKKALVVGGTSGIGHGVALHLAKRGVQVVIAGRNAKAGEAIVSQLNDISGLGHSFKSVDCFKLADVKSLASQYEAEGLDYLIMSQGMATIQGYTPTVDGFDQKLQLHYFSRVLLAKLLAPVLSQSAGGGKVMTILSAGVHSAYPDYASDFALSGSHYSIKNAADSAGFYNDIAMHRLAQEFPATTFVHAAPGFVNTNWGTEMPFLIRMFIRALQPLGTSIEACGENMVEGLLKSRGGFRLLDQTGRDITETNTLAEMKAADKVVWTKTEEALAPWLQG